jgi:hypothetical protein
VQTKLRETVSVKDFGAVGDGVTDDTAAFQAAIASEPGLLYIPDGIYILASSVIDKTECPNGISFIGSGNAGGPDGGSDGAVELRYTGAANTACFDIRNPNGTSGLGRLYFKNLRCTVTQADASFFWINFYNQAGVEYTCTGDGTTPKFVREIVFENVQGIGVGTGAGGTNGDFIRACKMFDFFMDDQCAIAGWRRGVYLKGCDNTETRGRFSNNSRHVHLERSSTFGNSNVIKSKWMADIVVDGSEPGYGIFSDCWEDTIDVPFFEPDRGSDGIIYLNGRYQYVKQAYFSVSPATAPHNVLLYIGENCREAIFDHPVTSTDISSWTITVATPPNWSDWQEPYQLIIKNPSLRFLRYLQESAWLLTNPRIKLSMDSEVLPWIQPTHPNVNLSSTAIGSKQHLITALNWQTIWNTLSATIGSPVVDVDGYCGYAMQIPATNLTCVGMRLVCGKQFKNGDILEMSILYKMSGVPSSGSFNWTYQKNGANTNANSLTVSTTYTTQKVRIPISGYVDGDYLVLGVYNVNVTDQTCNVAAILVDINSSVDGVSSDNGDASISLYSYTPGKTQLFNTPLTTNRVVSLSTAGASVANDGKCKFKVVRTAASTGAFTLSVGGLKSLSAGQWCEVEYNGSSWMLTAFGSL